MTAVILPVRGQIAGGLTETTRTDFGGRNYISGTVFEPSGGVINVRTRIRLSSVTAGEVLTTTDDSGRFVFSGLPNGSYSVIIDGEKEYSPVTQQVEINQPRGWPPQTYTLTIRLTAKPTTDKRPGVIRTENVGIPKHSLDLYKKAIELAKTDDHKGAIDQLKLAAAEYPGFLAAFVEMGVQYMKLNLLDKADESFQLALKIKPDAFEPLVNQGIILVRLKRYVDAEPVLRSALKIKDESAIGHYYLGRALASLKRYDDAEKEFNLAISLGGDDMKEAHRMLGSMYLDQGDNKRALVELETYLSLAPTAPDIEHLRTVIEQLRVAPTSISPAPSSTPKPGKPQN